MLFTWNIAPVVEVAGSAGADELETTGIVLFVSDMQSFGYDIKLYLTVNQILNQKNSKNYSNFFMEQQVLWLMCYYQLVFPIIFVLYSEDLLALSFHYLSYN